MRHSTQDLMVGLCSIGALVGLSVLLLRFGELSPLLESDYAVTLRANAAMGLRGGSQVLLEGVPVGEVKQISLDLQGSKPVVIVLSLRDPVPASVRPTISSGLLGGGAKIDLRIPEGAPTTPIDPTRPPTIEVRFTTMVDQLESIIAKVSEGDGTIGRLLNDPHLYEDMREAAERLTITLRDLQAMVRKVKEEGLELKF
ncbi:MAG: MCE family protein [Planctomycetes bacterium]|nr:MCE family protein [Planctomycetota bacterium]